MNQYTKEQTDTLHQQKFHFLLIEERDHILHITLNRESKKNALHPQMVNEIAFAMNYAHHQPHIWIVVFAAKGSVFCSGADLKAAMGIAEEHQSTIPEVTAEILIAELFNTIHKPTIARIEGDVFAGGFFFLAGCNIVLSLENVTLGLPEVKRGVFPFQVMAALLRVMPSRKVIDWCIRGYNLTAKEAVHQGLITKIVAQEKMDAEVSNIIDELLQNSPTAMRMGLEAYDQISREGTDHRYLMNMLTKTISSTDGMEGLQAFLQKRKPKWKGE